MTNFIKTFLRWVTLLWNILSLLLKRFPELVSSFEQLLSSIQAFANSSKALKSDLELLLLTFRTQLTKNTGASVNQLNTMTAGWSADLQTLAAGRRDPVTSPTKIDSSIVRGV